MGKFKEGDRIKRINSSFDDMKVGDIDVVVSSGNYGVVLKRYGNGHSPSNLILLTNDKEETKMEQFSKGDIVRRTNGSGSHKMVEGNIYTVESCELHDLYLTEVDEYWETDYFELVTKEATKMEAPETQLEKNALEEAKEEIVKREIKNKAETYKNAMSDFLTAEKKLEPTGYKLMN